MKKSLLRLVLQGSRSLATTTASQASPDRNWLDAFDRRRNGGLLNR